MVRQARHARRYRGTAAKGGEGRAEAARERGRGGEGLLLPARALDAALERRLEGGGLGDLTAVEEVVLLLLDAAHGAAGGGGSEDLRGEGAGLDELLRVREVLDARDDLEAELLGALHDHDLADRDAHGAGREEAARRAGRRLDTVGRGDLEEELCAAERLLHGREGHLRAVERGLDLLLVLVQRARGLLNVHGLGHLVLVYVGRGLEGWRVRALD